MHMFVVNMKIEERASPADVALTFTASKGFFEQESVGLEQERGV